MGVSMKHAPCKVLLVVPCERPSCLNGSRFKSVPGCSKFGVFTATSVVCGISSAAAEDCCATPE